MPPRRERRPRQNEEVHRNENEGNEGGRGAPPPPPPPPPHERCIEELFLNQKPPMFDGIGDPATAETWIRALERIFNFMRCTDQERLTCVAFQLTGSADFWWEARRKTMTPERLAQLTWEEFKTGIYDKYIPKSYRKAKEIEFYNLKQGQMSVTEYDRMFCDMSRYASDQVDTDEKMAEKFRAGLRHEIRMTLASHGGLTYPESLSRALDIEEAMPKEKSIVHATPITTVPPQQQNFREKRRWDGNRAPYENKRHQPDPNQPQNDERQAAPNQGGEYRPRTPHCARCSKFHLGECKAGRNVCYKCDGNGHFAKECPSNNTGMGARQNNQVQRPQLQALQAEPRGDPTV